MSRPVVYLAGPYSHPDPVENMHHAIKLADMLLDSFGIVPLVPHLTGIWHLVSPKPYEEWLAIDLELLSRCDALLRFGGESNGADREVEYANEIGIPVFHHLHDLGDWAEWRAP